MGSMRAPMKHPAHMAAKQQQQRLAGWPVVMAQLLGNHGDGGMIPHAGIGPAPER